MGSRDKYSKMTRKGTFPVRKGCHVGIKLYSCCWYRTIDVDSARQDLNDRET